MDLMHLPMFRKIVDVFRQSILFLHLSWITRLLQLCLIGRPYEKPEKIGVVSQTSDEKKDVAVSEKSEVADTTFLLPDLVGLCKFPLRCHPDADKVAKESAEWLDTGCPRLNLRQRDAMYGLQGGVLAGYSYTTGPTDRLRVIADYINYLFHLDNISDGMLIREADELGNVVMNALWFPESYKPTKGQPEVESNPGKLTRDIWTRCIRHAGPGVQKRFIETTQEFHESLSIQAKTRAANAVPDLESYIDCRRDTSACKPCWALIEYIHDIDLPDYVAEHPIIEAMGQAANDMVSWSNDIYSYNIEQARGDGYQNLVHVLIHYHGHTLQSAIDYAGDMWKQTLEKFMEDEKRLPSWGPEVDDMVQKYLSGLRDWCVGSLYWSFRTHRYFGRDGQNVIKHRTVKLISKVEPLFPASATN
ncbi:terpenoid synthase [Amanita rubescens]|nr:terpenoid synthase [Amanita rubescens]